MRFPDKINEKAKSADKKPQKYKDQDGREKVRMVPADDEIVKSESTRRPDRPTRPTNKQTMSLDGALKTVNKQFGTKNFNKRWGIKPKKDSAKMAEDTQIDELSRDLKNRYLDRATRDHSGANMARRHTTPGTKDHEYFKRKEKTLKKGITRASRANMLDTTNDSYEPQGNQIDEISTGTKLRYIKKADQQVKTQQKKLNKISLAIAKSDSPAKTAKLDKMSDKPIAKVQKRFAGMRVAAKKLAREQVEQIDEISQDKVHDYLSKSMNAADNDTRRSNDALKVTGKAKTASTVRRAGKVSTGLANRALKRELGIQQALRKQTGRAKVNATESVNEAVGKKISRGEVTNHLQHYGYTERNLPHLADRLTKITGKKHTVGGKDIFVHDKSVKEESQIDESFDITKMPHDKLSFHRSVPHGRYSNKEIESEVKRRKKTGEYTSNYNHKESVDEMKKDPYAGQPVGVHVHMKDKKGKISKVTFMGTHSAVAGAKKHIADKTKQGYKLHKKELAFAESVEEGSTGLKDRFKKVASKIKKVINHPNPKVNKNLNDVDFLKIQRKHNVALGTAYDRLNAYQKSGRAATTESVEQVDEISRGALHRYKKAAMKDRDTTAKDREKSFFKDAQTDKIKKRVKGIKQSQKNLWGKEYSQKRKANEDVEAIDEISNSLVKNYYNKASMDSTKRFQADRDMKAKRATTGGHGKRAKITARMDANDKKIDNREDGMARARQRMNKVPGKPLYKSQLKKEDTEHVNEISLNTIGRYVKKSSQASSKALNKRTQANIKYAKADDKNRAAGNTESSPAMKKHTATMDKHNKVIKKRKAGQDAAQAKIDWGYYNKEDVNHDGEQIDELKKSTYASYIKKASRSARASSTLSKSFDNDATAPLKKMNDNHPNIISFNKDGSRKKPDPEKYKKAKKSYDTNKGLAKDFKRKSQNRINGIDRAASSLAKESNQRGVGAAYRDMQIDEISKSAKAKYSARAGEDWNDAVSNSDYHASKLKPGPAGQARNKEHEKGYGDETKRANKRMKGLKRATGKTAMGVMKTYREDTEATEAKTYDSGWQKAGPRTVVDKGGNKHDPMSRTQHLSRLGLKKADEKNPPFDGPYKKTPRVITDKGGNKHDPMSRAQHQARLGLKSFIKKSQKTK